MAFSNHDLVFDSPTNNFATWNKLDTTATLSDGNLKVVTGNVKTFSNIFLPKSDGKYYAEYYVESMGFPFLGVYNHDTGTHSVFYSTTQPNESIKIKSVNTANTFTVTNGDIVSVLVDTTNQTIQWFKNGGLTPSNATPSYTLDDLSYNDYSFYTLHSSGAGTSTLRINFGQDPTFGGVKIPTKVYTDANGIGRFFYEPPTGALALCTANLAAATTAPTEYIVDETNQHLLTYNGNVTQSKFTPYATDGYSTWFTSDIASSQLRVPTHTNLEFGTDNFTVEFWMYHHGGDDYETIISYPQWEGGNGPTGTAWQIRLTTGNSLETDYSNNTGWIYNGSHTDLVIKSGYWNHVVLQRNGTQIKLYLNGIASSSIYNIGSGSIEPSSIFNTNFLCIGGYSSSGQDLGANLADIRIVKGSAVYTEDGNGNITPPSAPLTNITNTQFLLSTSSNRFVDSSSNAYTITTNGSPEISDWSPFTPEAVRTGYEYRNPDNHGGGSFYFDGNGDYLTIPGSADTTFGTGAFTIEFWLYVTNLSANTYHCLMDFRDSSTSGNDTDAFGFFIHGSAATAGNIYIFQGTSISFNQVLKGNQWNHIALVRTGTGSNELSLYLNGVNGTNQTLTTDLIATNTVHIGKYPVNSDFDLYGYMTDIRIIKGVAAYTGNFTPPISKLSTSQSSGTGKATVSTSDTKFLLQPYKSKIIKDILNYGSDETGKALTYVGNASVVNTSPYKDGVTGSFNFGGQNSGDYIDLGNLGANVNLTGSYTFEGWVYVIGNTSAGGIITSYDDAASGWRIIFRSNSKIVFEYYGGTNFLQIDNGYSILNKWTHFVVVSDGTTVAGYINGSRTDTAPHTTINGASTGGYTGQLMIGTNALDQASSWNMDGKIADLHFINGSAKYNPSNTTINVPYEPVTVDSTYSVVLAQPGRFIENTAEADNTDNFKAVTYAGDSNDNHSISTVGFQPDLIWIKNKSSAGQHVLIDSVRGDDRELFSSITNAEQNPSTTGHVPALRSIDSTGFTLSPNINPTGSTNSSPDNYVAWCWKAGGAPSADDKAMVDGVESTITGDAKLDAGTITPTRMSVNTDAGFSIVKYQGILDGSISTATIPHGLTSADFCIIKNLDNANTWVVSHTSIEPNVMALQSTGAAASTPPVDALYGHITSLNSNTVTITRGSTRGDNVGENLNSWDYIMYCWHSVEGYSKFGSYTGNESADGPYVECGFRPAWVMVKPVSGNHWSILDSERDEYNPARLRLLPSNSNSESGVGPQVTFDFLSNGFKLRTTDPLENNSGEVIFMAFAEQPFIYSNAR